MMFCFPFLNGNKKMVLNNRASAAQRKFIHTAMALKANANTAGSITIPASRPYMPPISIETNNTMEA